MEEHLARLGVTVQRETELKSFQENPEGLSWTIMHSNGEEETVEASWLIGCDGSRSTVRHQLGLEFPGSTLLSDWLLADLHLSGVAGSPAVNIYWHAEGLVALFPLGGSRYRIIADTGESTGPNGGTTRSAPSLDDAQKVLDVRVPVKMTATDPIWLSTFSINERKVHDYRVGRVFLAGDAAHVHSPAGGQGMNTGMQDACNLAWKLALVARSLCKPEPLLSSYSEERSAIAKLVLEVTGRATAVAVMRGGVKQSIRNHIAASVFGLAPVAHTMANVLSETAVGYSNSSLNGHSSHEHDPKPGKRAPIRQGESPVGAGNSPRVCSLWPSGNRFTWPT